MTTLTAIRAGITAAIKAAIPECQMTGYLLGTPTAPGFEIELGRGGIEYDQSMARGYDSWNLVVRGFAAVGLDEGGQMALDAWVDSSGATSVKQALEADKTLGGIVQSLHVTSCQNYRLMRVPAMPNAGFLCADWTVYVIATGA